MTGLSDEDRADFSFVNELYGAMNCNPDRRVESLLKFRHRMKDNVGVSLIHYLDLYSFLNLING